MSYIVVMGNITVPNITEISFRNNLFTYNPRGLIAPHLDGYNRIPAVATVRTRTNVEDFYRFNAPLIIFKKIKGIDEKKQALLTLGYMFNTTYNDNAAALAMGTLIGLGYLPVFLGVCQSFTAAMGNSAEAMGYEYLIGASDLSEFFNFPFKNINKAKNTHGLNFKDFRDNLVSGTLSGKYVGKIKTNIGNGEEVLGRAPFLCEMLNTILEGLPAYQEYKKQVQYPIFSDFQTAVAQLGQDALVGGIAGSEDYTALLAAKAVATIKIPRGKYESDDSAEAIKTYTLESTLTTLANAVGENLNFKEVLQAMTPHIFYEVGFREDTGEFFYRRSGAAGAKQSFQNPFLPASVIPVGSIVEYQKIWGGKLGETVASQVHGQTQLDIKHFAPYVQLGEQNLKKFGSSQFRQNMFGQLNTFFYDIENPVKLKNTEEFCGDSRHYRIKAGDDITPRTGTNRSFTSLTGVRRGESLPFVQNMANYTSKYNHAFPYIIWIGCSTYFMAPLGASVQPLIFPHTASALGLSSGRLSVTRDAFTSIEALNSYRIAGKALQVTFRSDGAYDEKYYLALTHAGQGFQQAR